MLFDDRYKTIKTRSEGVFRDRGSKFIAYAFPIRSEEVARSYLVKIKADHPKARHHCWALRLSPDRTVFRINDDGEPSGTAGRPILNVLLSHDLTNLLVVVVRYFGGTLLGVPGLINAYKSATADAVNNAEIIELTVNDLYSLSFAYPEMNQVMKIVKEEGLKILKQDFSGDCILEVEIAKSRLNAIIARLEKIEGLHHNYLTTI